MAAAAATEAPGSYLKGNSEVRGFEAKILAIFDSGIRGFEAKILKTHSKLGGLRARLEVKNLPILSWC